MINVRSCELSVLTIPKAACHSVDHRRVVKAIVRVLDPENRFHPPHMVLCWDESARCGLDSLNSVALCALLPVSFISIFLSTAGNFHQFSPNPEHDPSDCLMRGELTMLPPITKVGFDQFAEKVDCSKGTRYEWGCYWVNLLLWRRQGSRRSMVRVILTLSDMFHSSMSLSATALQLLEIASGPNSIGIPMSTSMPLKMPARQGWPRQNSDMNVNVPLTNGIVNGMIGSTGSPVQQHMSSPTLAGQSSPVCLVNG